MITTVVTHAVVLVVGGVLGYLYGTKVKKAAQDEVAKVAQKVEGA